MCHKLLTALLVLASFGAHADGILISWSASNVAGMTEARFTEAKSWTTNEILRRNLAADSWPETYLLMVAATQRKHDPALVAGLTGQLTNPAETALRLTSRLIIWERITRGDILFEGKGLQVDDDLFRVAGRANFLLRTITGKNFGLVEAQPSAAGLRSLQEKWTASNNGHPAAPYQNPFETADGSLREIHSLHALEALVHALQPSAAKDSLTSRCLRTLYHLRELPRERGTPASYCSPDTYTLSFLGLLTGQPGYDASKDYRWWQRWWDANNSRLAWNKEKAIFEVKS